MENSTQFYDELNSIFSTDNDTLSDYDNSSMTHIDIIDNMAVQVVFCILYTTIFILGIFGNVLVCYVVFRNKAMQTVTNLFITNLALSDILLCALAVPFTPLYTFLGRWVFGRIICHLVSYAQAASVYISTLTLTSIAIDRFFVIIYPFHPRMKLCTCIAIIIFIWLFSIIVSVPYGIFMNHKLGSNNLYYCDEAWPSEKFRKIFGTLTAILQFVIPFFMIAICYICVSLKLNDRAKAKPGSKNSRKEEADRERKRRTNRMLIAMVAVFGISWLPLNAVNVVNDFYIGFIDWKYFYLCFFMVHSVAMSSTCYNPFIYAWLNENFRKEFKQVLPCFDPSGAHAIQLSNRMGNWRSERTCNGNNETGQESLLQSSVMNRTASLKGGSLFETTSSTVIKSSGNETANHTVKNMLHHHPLKADSVEVENIYVPIGPTGVASYHCQGEAVKLHLISEESTPISNPPNAADH